MEENNKTAKKQLFWTRMTALFALVAAAAAVSLAVMFGAVIQEVRKELPKIESSLEEFNRMAGQAEKTLGDAGQLIEDLDRLGENAEQISNSLSDAARDLSRLADSVAGENIDRLARVLEDLGKLDFSALKDAADSLRLSIGPLSGILGRS